MRDWGTYPLLADNSYAIWTMWSLRACVLFVFYLGSVGAIMTGGRVCERQQRKRLISLAWFSPPSPSLSLSLSISFSVSRRLTQRCQDRSPWRDRVHGAVPHGEAGPPDCLSTANWVRSQPGDQMRTPLLWEAGWCCNGGTPLIWTPMG